MWCRRSWGWSRCRYYRASRQSHKIVEFAGRLRDKLFHGAAFSQEDLIKEMQPAFAVLENAPLRIADTPDRVLQDCTIWGRDWRRIRESRLTRASS